MTWIINPNDKVVLIAVSARWSPKSTTLHLYSVPAALTPLERGTYIQQFLDTEFPSCPELAWQEVSVTSLDIQTAVKLCITSLPKAV